MKKLLSLSLMLSLGLATVTPALNAVAKSQANPADVSSWQAAKKWWLSGRNMKALNLQEQRAFNSLKAKIGIGAITAAIIAMIGSGIAAIGGAAYLRRKPATPVMAGHLGQDLIDAAGDDDQAKVEELIAAGADVNAANQNRVTALMLAAYHGHENIVKKLLQADGIDVNAASPRGWTALMLAAYHGHENIVEKLLQADGIDVNAQEVTGWTALMLAAYHGHENIVRLLLDKGADKDLKNKDGQTAEYIARARGYEDLAKDIEAYRK